MDSKIIDFLAIPIVGVLLSVGIQWLKEKFKLSSFGAKVTTAGASVILGMAYFLLKDTSAWVPIVGILGSATVFWAWFLKQDSEVL